MCKVYFSNKIAVYYLDQVATSLIALILVVQGTETWKLMELEGVKLIGSVLNIWSLCFFG